jgi:serine/threonine protein kinase
MECAEGKRPGVRAVAPGLVLEDRWRLVKHIGKGGMGVVFRGVDLHKKRAVAVKFLAARHCDKPHVLARFEREARLMTTLRHPNISRLYDVGRHGVQPYIVMPFLRGLPLAQVLEYRHGQLSCHEALAVVGQMAAGLSFIHHHGLVHRDIKPQNVFINQKGRVIILDLGVARDKSDPGLTKPGTLVGTPYYMAPEQISGKVEVDKRTDVYALAAMTFELLVGRPPFIGTDPFSILQAHKHEPPPDASRLSKQVSWQVAREISCGLAKNKAERPQSASEFYANLKVLIDFHAEVDLARAFPFLSNASEHMPQGRKEHVQENMALETLAQTPHMPLPKQASAPASASSSSSSPVALESAPPARAGKTKPGRANETTFTGEDTNVSSFANETTPLPTPRLLPKGFGELKVVSTYKGSTTTAQLWLDGKPQGEAPISLLLPEGEYLLRLMRPKGSPVERRMLVSEGQSQLLRVDLP